MKIPFWHEPPQLDAPKQPGEVVYTTLQLTRLRLSAISFQRFVIISMSGMLLSGMAFAAGSWLTDLHRIHDQCISTNHGRVEIRQAFSDLYDGFIAAYPNQPIKQKAATDFKLQQLARFDKALPQRHCP